MARSNALGLVSCGLLGLACLMFILSNALPSWGVVKLGGVTVAEGGLWRQCVKFGTNTCANRPLGCSGVPSSLIGQCIKLIMARVFIIFACMLSAFGALFLFMVGISQSPNASFSMFGKACAAVSLMSGILGVSLGISWAMYGGDVTVGAAAILGIVGIILSFISTVFAVMIPKN
ncbi:unnamed protein product [Rotaria magnacalcarata]|uniref:Claudin n=1 Tax=Rotaria magnacalcarata TaxID=392030 RepID=A0A816XSL4_9BILA|nr:unnamed protein product [Rotaria magnacalcarata]CAF2150791.1 unnamed protein product [Rotaria magnacalcarata]CAF3764145.1 unnamed protein product [Rotaria magnacalcarata]CAF4042469.1 unnamed protein product [Rotaria magnacalcarata]